MKEKRIKQKVVSTLSAFVALILLTVGFSFLQYFTEKPAIVISDTLRYPVGSSVSLSDLVLSVENGVLENEEETFSSQIAGEKTVLLRIRNRLGLLKEERFTLKFYDDTPPTISAPSLTFTITEGESVNFLEGVTATDDTGAACNVRIDGEYDFNTPGTYHLRYTAADHTGNAVWKDFVLTVNALVLPFDENGVLTDGVYKTKKGFVLEVKDGVTTIDGQLMVNRTYSLPREYKLGDRTLTAETQTAYNRLRAAATAAGYNLFIKNGARDWNDQNYYFNIAVNQGGTQNAEISSTRPGHSEHQSGLAIDLLVSDAAGAADQRYAPTLAWLKDNAYKYGFVLRYPEGKSEVTGCTFEPWHYRYVGVELAEILYNGGDWISLEEYFGVDSVYRGYTAE